MSVWLMRNGDEKSDWLNFCLPEWDELKRLFGASRFPTDREPVEMEKDPRRKKLVGDNFWVPSHVPAFSVRAAECLAPLISECVQFVQAKAGSEDLVLLNVLSVVDCLGESEVELYRDSTVIREVHEYRLDPPEGGFPPIFYIKGIMYEGCFVTDAFVELVHECGLSGFMYSLVWDKRLPPSFLAASGPYRMLGDGTLVGFAGRGDCGDDWIWEPVPGGVEGLVGRALAQGAGPETPCALAPAGPAPSEPEAPAPAPYDGPALDDDIRAVREEALASLPGLPAAAGELSDGPCGALGSRVCGSPAMLPGEEWPEGPGGEPLCFLAQLDMADLPPLPGFPGKGLLRLFVGEEPEFGLDPSDMAAQAGFRALWAPDPEGAALRAAPEEAEDGLGWGDGPWAVRFAGPFESRPDDVDFRVEGAFAKLWNAAHPGLPVGRMHDDADRYASDPGLTWSLSSREGASAGGPPAVQVGGYPVFCQDDWRNWEERYRPYDTVLFQLGCDWDRWIAIGDGGRMYFLIPSEKLAAGDFSDIMYWWDCG